MFQPFTHYNSILVCDSLRSEKQFIEVPAIGNHPIVLGGFYSAVEDEFLPGAALWSSSDVEKYKNTVHHPRQETVWAGRQSVMEVMVMVGIDLSGSIALDFEIGKFSGYGYLDFMTKFQVRIIN